MNHIRNIDAARIEGDAARRWHHHSRQFDGVLPRHGRSGRAAEVMEGGGGIISGE